MKNSSFGILKEMDRYENDEMTESEKIDFIQLLIDLDMVWIMAPSWVHRAEKFLASGDCVKANEFVRPDGTIAKEEE